MGEADVMRALQIILNTPERVIVERALQLVPLRCPSCGSESFVRIGKIRRGSGLWIQRFRCKVCGKTFTELQGTPLSGVHDLRLAVTVAYFSLCLGMGPASISKATERPYSTVVRLLNRVRKNRRFFLRLLSSLGVTNVKDCTKDG